MKLIRRPQAPRVNRQPLRRKEAVVQQAEQVEGLDVVPRHVRIAEDEIHVVDRIDAAEQRPQLDEPVGVSLFVGQLCATDGGSASRSAPDRALRGAPASRADCGGRGAAVRPARGR